MDTHWQRRVNLGLPSLLADLALWLVLALLLSCELVGNGSLVLGVECLVGVGLALLEAVGLLSLALWDVLLRGC